MGKSNLAKFVHVEKKTIGSFFERKYTIQGQGERGREFSQNNDIFNATVRITECIGNPDA